MNKEYIEVEVGWYNELIRTKAKWDLLIDNLLHDNYPNFNTEEVNDWVNNYYFRFGARLPEKRIEPEKIIVKEKAPVEPELKGVRRKSLKITEEGLR